MNQHVLQTEEGQKLQNRFFELRKELSTLSWITHGSVTPNHPGNWRWTTKVKAKTVTLSLSAEQADLNGAKLVRIWDDFRRPLFYVGGAPFLCEVLSLSGSSWGGVF